MSTTAGPRSAIPVSDLRQHLEAEAHDLLREVTVALERNPALDPDMVRHTLALLRLDPLTRLNRSLIRGRATTVHRT